MPLVEKRYAEALIKTSNNENSLDNMQRDLDQVYDVISNNEELNKLLNNASIKSLDKKSVLEKIFSTQIEPITMNFLKLLVDKGRIKNLKEIKSEFSILADELRRYLNIDVITAMEIDNKQLEEIGEKFKKQYNSKAVKVNHKVDPEIIGGVIVKIGDRMIDASIKGKLDNMLDALNS